MATEAAKLIYRLRGQTAECVNAQARNRGFGFMPVRGQARCRTVASRFAITHNLVVRERNGLSAKGSRRSSPPRRGLLDQDVAQVQRFAALHCEVAAQFGPSACRPWSGPR